MSISHLFLRKHVTDAFVFSDLEDVGIDTKLVQRTAEEEHVGRESVNKQFSRWREIDFVAGAGDVVLLVHPVFHIGVDGFARGTKIGNGVANLFSLAPTGAGHVYVEHDRFDAVVDLRFFELQNEIG